MFKKYKDVFCGSFLIVLAAVLFILSFGIRSVALNLIKADFFPRLDAALLLVLGMILIVTGMLKARSYQPEAESSSVPFWKYDPTVSMLETLALIALYITVLKPVGFIISTMAYLVIQMFVLTPKEKRNKKNLLVFCVISLIVSVVVYLVFVKVFYLMLPAGILQI